MRVSVPLLTVVGAAGGAVAAVLAYQAGAGGASAVTSPNRHTDAATTRTATPAVAKTIWRPCEKDTVLRKGVCERIRTKIVVVQDPAPAPSAYPAAAPPAIHQPAPGPSRPSHPSRHPHAVGGVKKPAAPVGGAGGEPGTPTPTPAPQPPGDSGSDG